MDEETVRDLIDSFHDIYDDVESCLIDHTKTTDSKEVLNKLFRAIHNVKGNAGMFQLQAIVAFAHALEEVAGALREEKYDLSPEVSEIIQISMDRLRDIHYRDILGKQYDNLRDLETADLLMELSFCDRESILETSLAFLSFFGAGVIDNTASELPEQKQAQKTEVQKKNAITTHIDDEKLQSDLVFFQEMALQIDSQKACWDGRCLQLFDWAMKMNKIGGNLIAYEQFAAAIYMHDIGLSLINDSCDVPENLSNGESSLQAPLWGYEILSRIPGWDVAAQIVLGHQENVDGSGYPHGKTGDEIHPGACILAIIVTFFSITRGRADKDKRKSIVRAISEINSHADTRFDGTWVQCFNHMIRTELKDGVI